MPRSTDEAFLMLKQLLSCSAPTEHNLGVLTSNLNDAEMEDYLVGADRKTWEDPQLRSDLAALSSDPDMDGVSTWLATRFLGPFHHYVGRRIKKQPYSGDQIYNYSGRHVRLPVRFLTTVFSCLLPVLSIVILYFVQSTLARLGITAAFTALFSGVLALLTDAKLGEIFTATAAWVLMPLMPTRANE